MSQISLSSASTDLTYVRSVSEQDFFENSPTQPPLDLSAGPRASEAEYVDLHVDNTRPDPSMASHPHNLHNLHNLPLPPINSLILQPHLNIPLSAYWTHLQFYSSFPQTNQLALHQFGQMGQYICPNSPHFVTTRSISAPLTSPPVSVRPGVSSSSSQTNEHINPALVIRRPHSASSNSGPSCGIFSCFSL